MNKPQPKSITAYDFNQCTEYIEKKYKIDTRDYASKHKGNGEYELLTEYQDFWHWIINNHDIHNGCYFWLSRNDIEDGETPTWVIDIIDLYLKEFGDEKEEIYFYVWW